MSDTDPGQVSDTDSGQTSDNDLGQVKVDWLLLLDSPVEERQSLSELATEALNKNITFQDAIIGKR